MAIPHVGPVDPSVPPMPTFLCWDEVSGSEETGRSVRGWDAHMAAESFVGDGWREHRRDEQRVCVRDAEGKVRRFVVYLEMVPSFTAQSMEESEER